MGSVWRAKQSEPVKRFVAVKLIKAGMDSKQVVARFDAERQALALMDHPNIAKVLDGGLHDGRPYFVMELVKGVPITEYCDHEKLTPHQRLELFVSVCNAIQHAHQKGIIHRDIKPSNVLVAMYDDQPVVKVIDFGVAKATGGNLTEATIDTGFGSVVGTPQYMSPEQATFNNLDIDTRSDVYALGILLYELLAGSTPFSAKELQQKGLLEILRVVREEEPPRPSTRLSTANALPSLSAQRGTEPKKLAGLLRNELDWIVMKALEKDRKRRYETANGFAADVQRYLAGEPVQAHPPSRTYRLSKFVRRNRVQVMAGAAVSLALVAGVVGTRWQAIEAEQARAGEAKRAEAERDAREEAVKNLTFAKKGNEILGSIFKGLNPKANFTTVGELTQALKDSLNKAVRELEGSAIGDPLVVAEMQDTLGESLLGLGDAEQAILLFEKASETRKNKLGINHADTLKSMNDLAVSYLGIGRQDLAMPIFEDILKLRKANLGADHSATLKSMGNLATGYSAAGNQDLALQLSEETLKLSKTKLGTDHTTTLQSMNNLAMDYLNAGKLELALPLFEETLKLRTAKLGADHTQTLRSMNDLAECYRDAGNLKLALPLLEKTLRLRKAKLGDQHPDTLSTMDSLAGSYEGVGKLDLALPLFEEVLKLRKTKLGDDHPQTLISMNNLANGYRYAGKLDLAMKLLEETLKLSTAKLGANHPATLTNMNNLAQCYSDAGKPEIALQLHEETLRLAKANLGVDHPHTLSSMGSVAEGYRVVGKLDLALPLLEETLKLKKVKLGFYHPSTLNSMNSLALCYQADEKLDLALPLYTETLKLRIEKLGADHPDTLQSMNNLGFGYHAAGQLDLALPLYEETLKLKKTKMGEDHPATLSSMNNLAEGYKAAGKLDFALQLHEETLKLRIARMGADHPNTHDSMMNLGATYSTLKQGEKAAAILKALVSHQRIRNPKDDSRFARLLAQVSNELLTCGQFADAEELLRECWEIRNRKEPDVWSTFNTMSQLGGALLGQKEYAEAESLLVKGYEGMKEREEKIPPKGAVRLPASLDRLIEFYTATNKPEKTAKYQYLRAMYPTTTEVSSIPKGTNNLPINSNSTQ
ncbi:tetratricopeptide repeat protein [Pirellulaceae bacterium SH467]